jgi:hypothetical protein
MQRLKDGTYRFSPKDLIAYLEGDFAAWCERNHAERSLHTGNGVFTGTRSRGRQCTTVHSRRLGGFVHVGAARATARIPGQRPTGELHHTANALAVGHRVERVIHQRVHAPRDVGRSRANELADLRGDHAVVRLRIARPARGLTDNATASETEGHELTNKR